MRIVIAGAVSSTLTTLKKLVEHQMDIVGVLGYEPASLKNVSAYTLLKPVALENDLDYKPFVKINDEAIVEQVKAWKPDLLFVVGLSQLIKDDLINIPTHGVVGFHPTSLPRGRGRAPIAWSIINEKRAGANFFLIDDGVDSGPILAQELFDIEADDYAEDFELKMIDAIQNALDKWLPELKKGIVNAVPQNDAEASYYARRAPNDGCISWNNSAEEIYTLIRASSRPHPGAFTFKENIRVLVWKARPENELKITGVVGRVLDVDENGHALVQTGNGLLWLTEYELYDFDDNQLKEKLRVGQKLGYYTDLEIYRLKKEIKQLKNQLQ
jgi:methionyl-tRNA formyltransferase